MNPDFHLHQLNRPKDADVAQDVRAFQDQELQKSDDDAAILARIGKRQVLKRNFGLVSMTGFSSSLMCTWEGILTNFFLGYQNGGPGGLIYGFLFNWFGTLSVFTVIGELASMFPTAGGQYHWVGVLAPASHRNFLSYITGWLTACGWVATYSITAYAVSSLIENMVMATHPDYHPTGWQGTLIYWGVLAAALSVNTILSSALPLIEVFVLALHILGFAAILIPLAYLAPHNTAKDVFTTFLNTGGWYTQALAVFIGLNGNAGAFVGTDGAVHMSEEVKNSTTNVAKSMIASTTINGCLAFGILLAVLFTKVDVDSVADDQYPFIAILAQGTQSEEAAIVMAALVAILQFTACTGALASSSRIIWSFARDNGLPFSGKLRRINTRTTMPITAIMTAFVIAALLGLINIGSTTVYDAFISLMLEALFLSYLVATILVLIYRVTGRIVATERQVTQTPSDHFAWGPWRVPGIPGIVINIFACIYLMIICFFAFWPNELPVTPQTMNFSSLVTGCLIIFSSIHYLVKARKIFHGPMVENWNGR